jgi:uncharacterized protein
MKDKFDWKKIDKIVYDRLHDEKSGHDYSHVKRVFSNAMIIAKSEKKVDYDILKAACLLHDITMINPKTHHVESSITAGKILKDMNISDNNILKIQHCIINHNRNFGKEKPLPKSKLSIEAKILVDADNIDALGSIGIVRMIQFSTRQGVPLFHSKNDKLDTTLYGNMKFMINISNKMLTVSGTKLAKTRVKVMNDFQKCLADECKQSHL